VLKTSLAFEGNMPVQSVQRWKGAGSLGGGG
jgi:hypothetical protein